MFGRLMNRNQSRTWRVPQLRAEMTPATLKFALVFFAVHLGATISFAEDSSKTDSSGQTKAVREVPLPDCDWSKSNSTEFENCQKERDKLEKMSPRERRKYDRESGSVSITGRGGLVGNRVRVKRGGAGGR